MTRKHYPALSSLSLSLAAAVLASTLAGCAPIVIGAAVGTGLMVMDRRTSGAQIDDEAIELRAASRLSEAFGDKAHINVASYNRQVLLTGEATTDAIKQQAEQIVSRVDNVRGIVNDVAVMTPTTLPQRSGDVLITGKIRASIVDAQDLQATAYRVVTERGNVYLMGRVTQREADRATAIARQVSGVQRVVRIFEIATPEELRASGIQVPSGPAQAPQAPPVTTATPSTSQPFSASQPPSAEAGPPPSAADASAQPATGAVATPVR